MAGDRWEIAQLNVGRAVSPLDEAPMAGFMARLDEINALAERSPGFVWRLQGESGNNTDYKADDGDPLFIVNLSVWSSLEDAPRLHVPLGSPDGVRAPVRLVRAADRARTW